MNEMEKLRLVWRPREGYYRCQKWYLSNVPKVWEWRAVGQPYPSVDAARRASP